MSTLPAPVLACHVQAIMARKFRSSGDNTVGTEWALNYQLHPHLRMTFHISSSNPYPRSVFFQWNSEGVSTSLLDTR